ncbi:MAG: hypothetical protein L3J35_03555 [Bacteroidales bacterium]|nr:hypothetical protein [Bacteroidales bacterium]
MIFKPEHNDIVLNFYRAKAYKFDKDNMQHWKDLSRCRYATFQERERFLKLNKEIAHINEVLDLTVRNRSKWDKKDVPELTFNLSERVHGEFIKLANKLNIYSYESLISELFQIASGKVYFKSDTELEEKIIEQKRILRMFKNELEKIEL